MTLSPDRIQYLELRHTTDCILGYQVGQSYQFHGADALVLANVFGLPLESRWTEERGEAVPMCVVGIAVQTLIEGDQLRQVHSFDAELKEALNDAGYPLALAHERTAEDGAVFRAIDIEFRPRHDRPPLRVV